MAKKKAVWIIGGLLVAAAAGAWWKFFRTMKDKFGNTFRMNLMDKNSAGDAAVLVNGVKTGGYGTIGTLRIENGYAMMKTSNGKSWKFEGSWKVVV